jgi:hypothetical protein
VRLLLDECVDRRLAREIRGHEVSTVSELGWAGIRNGDLLVQASAGSTSLSPLTEIWHFNRYS